MTKELLNKEKKFLDKVYSSYRFDVSPQSRVMQQLTMKTFVPYVTGGNALELGCSDGFLTEMIAAKVEHLDVVDGSKKFLRKAAERHLPNVCFIYSLFEEFSAEKKYDYVFASYVLEHVLDPVAVLEIARDALKPEGRLMLVVPNARALSRQLALHMGLLRDLKELTQNDHDHGHRRVYDRVALNRDIAAAGFRSISQGGIMLKPFADFQMDELISKRMLKETHLEGLYELGMEYPDLCGSLFSICEIRK